MKRDAFDDLVGAFDYDTELNKAKAALNEKIGAYINENPGQSYRILKVKFGLSIGSLSAIARKYSRKRKRGRPRRQRQRPVEYAPLVHRSQGVSDLETSLRALDDACSTRLKTEASERAYEAVVRWLKGSRSRKDYKRARWLADRYAALRGNSG